MPQAWCDKSRRLGSAELKAAATVYAAGEKAEDEDVVDMLGAFEAKRKRLVRPIFEVEKWAIGESYFVRITFSDGTADKIEGFAKEDEARRWIRNESVGLASSQTSARHRVEWRIFANRSRISLKFLACNYCLPIRMVFFISPSTWGIALRLEVQFALLNCRYKCLIPS